jgi:hypothetical protein
MGGFTKIYLRDNSRENVSTQNARLELMGVPKQYRFYSEDDVILEYESFRIGDGTFPDDQFPREKIKTLEDFKEFWNPKALGEVFAPYIGCLSFDCYFGRTSKRAMRLIGKYLVENHDQIDTTGGSFSTFMERGMTKLERQIIEESGILQNY